MGQVKRLIKAIVIYGYGLFRLRETRTLMDLKDKDLWARQNITKPFLQAQNEIQLEIVFRKQELIAKKLLDENQYKLYQKLNNPFNKNSENVLYFSR